MPIRKKYPQSGIWWIDIRTPSGERVRRSTGTKDRKAAQEYHDRVKSELWRQDKLGAVVERTFDEAALGFLKASIGQSDFAAKKRHTSYWLDLFSGRAISSLTSEDILQGLRTHRTYKDRPTKALSPATRNRYVSSIMRLLNLCVSWGWIAQSPKLTKFREQKVRIRWITRDQANALMDKISQPWVRDVCQFALATGMRAGEILSLEWGDLDLERRIAWVTADRAKSGVARPVPLNAEALNVLARRTSPRYTLVFTRGNGVKVAQVDPRGLKRACAELNIADFHFHDFRHTWASWHAQAGTPLMALKEMGGWQTIEMVQKYAHMAPTHLSDYANAVMFWSPSQPEKKTPPCRVALSA